jgi:hypothetical protein
MKKRPCLLYRMFVRNPHLARYCNECGLEQKLTSAEAEIEKLKVELCDSMPVAKHYESVRRSNLELAEAKAKLIDFERLLLDVYLFVDVLKNWPNLYEKIRTKLNHETKTATQGEKDE